MIPSEHFLNQPSRAGQAGTGKQNGAASLSGFNSPNGSYSTSSPNTSLSTQPTTQLTNRFLVSFLFLIARPVGILNAGAMIQKPSIIRTFAVMNNERIPATMKPWVRILRISTFVRIDWNSASTRSTSVSYPRRLLISPAHKPEFVFHLLLCHSVQFFHTVISFLVFASESQQYHQILYGGF